MENVGVDEAGTPVGVKDEAVSPVGDFIALVASFAGGVFALALTWYKNVSGTMRGVDAHNPIGVICFAVSVMVFAFAVVVLIGRFINPNFRLKRSPGWVYALGASIIFMACIVGLAVPPNIGGAQAGISVGLILELFVGAAIGVGGLLKF